MWAVAPLKKKRETGCKRQITMRTEIHFISGGFIYFCGLFNDASLVTQTI
jgi:hypothetical protein